MADGDKLIPDMLGPKLRQLWTAMRADGWVNLMTGIGTDRDKTKHTRHVRGDKLDYVQLESLYQEDDMAERICSALPEDSLRTGYRVEVSEDAEEGGDTAEDGEHVSEVGDAMLEEHKRLNVAQVVEDSATFARAFGGAVALIGANDGALNFAEPLNEERIQSIDYLTCFDIQYVSVATWYTNPAHPKYGLPEKFLITSNAVGPSDAVSDKRHGYIPGAVYVHESRLLVFDGERVTLNRRIQNNGWGDSVLQRANEVLGQFGMSWAATAHLLQDSAQAKFKIDGLIQMISSGDLETMQKRMSLVDLQRSISRAIMLDAEREEFQRDPLQLTGLPDTLDKMMLRLASVARMPVTRLMGQSPAGMNATGESDRALWYDSVQSYRRRKITPHLERVTKLCFLAKNGPTKGKLPDDWCIEFNPLWESSSLEQAQEEKAVAETDAIYITNQVFTPEEIALSRIGVRGYQRGYSAVDVEARKRMLQANAEPPDATGDEEPTDEQVPPLATPIAGEPGAAPKEGEEPKNTPASADPTVPDAADSELALNGTQVTSMLSIYEGVAAGKIEREAAIAQLQIGFRLTEEQATKVLGTAGTPGGFKAEPEPPPVPFGGKPPGDGPPTPPKGKQPGGPGADDADTGKPAPDDSGAEPATGGKRNAPPSPKANDADDE